MLVEWCREGCYEKKRLLFRRGFLKRAIQGMAVKKISLLNGGVFLFIDRRFALTYDIKFIRV